MTQPDALRLADLLQDECGVDGYVLDESAAELRRQHAECNDLARQLNESNERNGRLIAQRDALLEALVKCRDRFFPADQPEQDRDELWGPVNAAIKAVEGEKE